MEPQTAIDECRQVPRNRRKTRTGCLRCKQRRIKCDETNPACNQCTRRGYDCPGFTRPLKWSSKYETSKRPISTRSHENPSSAVPLNIDQGTHPQFCGALSGDHASIDTTGHLGLEQVYHGFGSSHDESIPVNNQDNFMEPSFFLNHTIWDQFITTDFQHDNHELPELYSDILIPRSLNSQDTCLSNYYFSNICRINCAVDSSSNPFRAWIADSMSHSPLVYHCILSMSAAHLAEKDDGLKRVALTHREEAVSRLEREVLRTDQTIQSIDTVYSDFNLVVLFICILLGMTDSWHNPTMLGLKYLHSARLLFKRLSPVVIDSVQSTKERNSIRFIAGIMAYWEALVSFLKDQPLNATSYLSSFVDESYDIIPSNPWTGVSTPLFIYLARVGALGRQRETMQKLNLSSLALDAEERIQATLTKKAREIEMALLGYRIPPLDKIEQTHDIQTPVIHLQKTAQIFRLTALLEVYLSFPELFTSCAREFSSSECDSSYRLEISRPSKMLSLATGILTIISTLPLDSGTNVILCLPLIVAGSALQYSSPASTSQKIGLFDELANIHNEQGVHEHWRSFVRERLKYIHRFVGLASVLRALEVVERTWFRADVQRIADKQGMSESFVHWTNVMVDERLETIFG